MTLASKLLEGYCPEGYEIVEEGLTPDIMMERVNSICTECITELFAVTEAYFTDDLVAQTQVLTEGSGVVDKIKELISKFVEKVKKIWKWFTDKVKQFPAWLKGLFKKVEENADTVAKRIDIQHRDVDTPDLAAVDKYLSAVGDIQAKVKEYSDKVVKLYGQVDFIGVLGSAERILKDAAKNQTNLGVDNKKLTEEINRMWNSDSRDGLDDDLEKFNKDLTVEKNRFDSAKTVKAHSTKVASYALKVKKASMSADSGIIKPVEGAVKVVESTLSQISAPSFQSRLENVFMKNDKNNNTPGVATNYAQSYITQSTRILTAVTADMNKIMSIAKTIVSGYQAVNVKLVGAVRKTPKEGDNQE